MSTLVLWAAIGVVTGSVAHAEAGRSQRLRVCLNGLWQMVAGDDLPVEPPEGNWRPARVPGLFRSYAPHEFAEELPKSAAEEQPNSAWYRLDFPIPSEWEDGRRLGLHFSGLNYRARVLLNGEEMAAHAGPHLPLRVDITDRARFGGRNRLEVRVQACEVGDKIGRDGAYAGIWRDVTLETRPPAYIADIPIVTSVRRRQLTVHPAVHNAGEAEKKLLLRHEVLLGGRTVLRLPECGVVLGAGEMRSATTAVPWQDPILWAPPPHGKPVLYRLRSTLIDRDSGQVLDQRDTRFGFREFWAEGKQFYLNGKPFFLKGDLCSLFLMATESREFVTLYYQAERAANINFIRLHCQFGFQSEAWLDVADELGMLIEPQQYIHSPAQALKRYNIDPQSPEAEPFRERFELLKLEWRDFVARNRNHPAIVMYSIDNEAVSQAAWGQPDPGDTVNPAVHDLDEVHGIVRELDQTRLIEAQGDVRLGTAHKLGQYRELQVFNAHPYGDPLGDALRKLQEEYSCPPDIPVHVGEIYFGCQDPFNWWTRPASMLRRPRSMFRQYDRWGKYMRRSILSVRDAGATGASLCTGLGAMYCGSVSPTEVQLGAWDVSMMDADFSDPVFQYGRGRSVNVPAAGIRWPSLSGPGTKPRWLAQFVPRGYGNEFNWFDPTRPTFVTSVAHDWIRRAYREVDGKAVGPLRSWRSPELVVVVPQSAAGEYVFVGELGSLVAPDGTARFVLWEPGEYRVACPAIGAETSATVAAPPLKPKAGYDYVQWVALGDADAEPLRGALAGPVQMELIDPVEAPPNRAEWDVEQERAVVGNAPYTIRWGDGRIFEGTAFSGLAPDWITALSASGGRQDRHRLSYVVDADAEQYHGNVWIGLDREAVKGNVRLEIEAMDTGYLYLQLRGKGWETVCNNLTEGNLLGGTGERVKKTIEVPLDEYPEATIIILQRMNGPVEVSTTTLTPLW